ncbi:MAG: Crp/Fnr family transcriptional regulator [Bacteroidota bacterium]
MHSLSPFIEHLRQFVDISAADGEQVASLLRVRQYAKGDILLEEGRRSQSFFFLLRGCVRMYYLVDGVEKNTFFYTENQFVSSYESFVRATPAKHYIACLEDCELVVITQENAFQLLSFSPKFEQLSRMIMEEELIIYQQMLSTFITQNAEQRYQQFMDAMPELAQRIPQYHLASYLGVSPETLSRIRARLSRPSLS